MGNNGKAVSGVQISAEHLALPPPPLTTKDHEKETDTNESKTRRKEEIQASRYGGSIIDSRTEAFAG